ncbi:hypothetical protein HDU76_011320 [Blyttiomyces sp. JEL0837]|nr:hypothetical protein HDU76_011320 [Blyttiomyces sp. JEL0837]
MRQGPQRSRNWWEDARDGYERDVGRSGPQIRNTNPFLSRDLDLDELGGDDNDQFSEDPDLAMEIEDPGDYSQRNLSADGDEEDGGVIAALSAARRFLRNRIANLNNNSASASPTPVVRPASQRDPDGESTYATRSRRSRQTSGSSRNQNQRSQRQRQNGFLANVASNEESDSWNESIYMDYATAYINQTVDRRGRQQRQEVGGASSSQSRQERLYRIFNDLNYLNGEMDTDEDESTPNVNPFQIPNDNADGETATDYAFYDYYIRRQLDGIDNNGNNNASNVEYRGNGDHNDNDDDTADETEELNPDNIDHEAAILHWSRISTVVTPDGAVPLEEWLLSRRLLDANGNPCGMSSRAFHADSSYDEDESYGEEYDVHFEEEEDDEDAEDDFELEEVIRRYQYPSSNSFQTGFHGSSTSGPIHANRNERPSINPNTVDNTRQQPQQQSSNIPPTPSTNPINRAVQNPSGMDTNEHGNRDPGLGRSGSGISYSVWNPALESFDEFIGNGSRSVSDSGLSNAPNNYTVHPFSMSPTLSNNPEVLETITYRPLQEPITPPPEPVSHSNTTSRILATSTISTNFSMDPQSQSQSEPPRTSTTSATSTTPITSTNRQTHSQQRRHRIPITRPLLSSHQNNHHHHHNNNNNTLQNSNSDSIGQDESTTTTQMQISPSLSPRGFDAPNGGTELLCRGLDANGEVRRGDDGGFYREVMDVVIVRDGDHHHAVNRRSARSRNGESDDDDDDVTTGWEEEGEDYDDETHESETDDQENHDNEVWDEYDNNEIDEYGDDGEWEDYDEDEDEDESDSEYRLESGTGTGARDHIYHNSSSTSARYGTRRNRSKYSNRDATYETVELRIRPAMMPSWWEKDLSGALGR